MIVKYAIASFALSMASIAQQRSFSATWQPQYLDIPVAPRYSIQLPETAEARIAVSVGEAERPSICVALLEIGEMGMFTGIRNLTGAEIRVVGGDIALDAQDRIRAAAIFVRLPKPSHLLVRSMGREAEWKQPSNAVWRNGAFEPVGTVYPGPVMGDLVRAIRGGGAPAGRVAESRLLRDSKGDWHPTLPLLQSHIDRCVLPSSVSATSPGSSVVRFRVDTQGRVFGTHVVFASDGPNSSKPLESVVTALEGCTLKPFEQNGAPVTVVAEIPVAWSPDGTIQTPLKP